MTDSAAVQSLLFLFRALAPWHSPQDFSNEVWQRYIDAAWAVEKSNPVEVETALTRFLDDPNGSATVENETRMFLLMRFVFDLPERAPADQRRIFKGLVNWPAIDAEGNVNLSWPVGWQGDGRPTLLASFEGADGPRYGAIEEYRYLLSHFSFRKLQKGSE